MTTPILDVTQHSALAICPVKRCGWRTIQVSTDMALLRFHEHHARRHARGGGRPCRLCGSTRQVMPRKRLCEACHRDERAAKARAAYKTKGRPGRKAS